MSNETLIGAAAFLASFVGNLWQYVKASSGRAKLKEYVQVQQHFMDIWLVASHIGGNAEDLIGGKGQPASLSAAILEQKKAIQMLCFNALKTLGTVHQNANWYVRPEIQRQEPREQ